jgi:hypothetical protein
MSFKIGNIMNAIGGLAGLMTMNQSKERFTTEMSNTTAIIIVLVVLAICILQAIAVYKMTNSGLATFLFVLFGYFYVSIAIIYYGFSGYKIRKMS